MAIMESKKVGTCNNCRGEISVGQLIDWDRTNGATHHKSEKCEKKVATETERKAYEKHLVAELKAWNGEGSYRPTSFGDFIHAQR